MTFIYQCSMRTETKHGRRSRMTCVILPGGGCRRLAVRRSFQRHARLGTVPKKESWRTKNTGEEFGTECCQPTRDILTATRRSAKRRRSKCGTTREYNRWRGNPPTTTATRLRHDCYQNDDERGSHGECVTGHGECVTGHA